MDGGEVATREECGEVVGTESRVFCQAGCV
jgi:hypothetical protein